MGWLSTIFFGPSSPADGQSASDENEAGWSNQTNQAEAPWHINSGQDDGTDQAAPDPYHDASGNKIRPEVRIEHVKADLSNDSKHVELWAKLKNHSMFDVEVTRVNILGQHTSPMRFLKPGELHELRIYAGDTPTSNAYHTADVQYKIVGSGDYFQANHAVRYEYEENEHGRFYVPEEFDFIEPVKDI